MIRDRAGGRTPDLGYGGDPVDRRFEIPDTMRHAHQPGVDMQPEKPSSVRAVGMQPREGFHDGVAPDRGMNLAMPDQLHVVPFGLVRDREQWLRAHAIG